MKRIEYKITYGDGNEYTVTVEARNINSGFRKAVKHALFHLNPDYEINKVEFWMVKD